MKLEDFKKKWGFPPTDNFVQVVHMVTMSVASNLSDMQEDNVLDNDHVNAVKVMIFDFHDVLRTQFPNMPSES